MTSNMIPSKVLIYSGIKFRMMLNNILLFVNRINSLLLLLSHCIVIGACRFCSSLFLYYLKIEYHDRLHRVVHIH